ncbi:MULTISPECIES: hypothetical protein [Lachnospiraceae]|jgi:hypothetical protein|uniref:Uncharacterized protein n=1 Tax=Faecalicatena acetigenes TaxID=2981790 RepID=A0ABT2T8T3_9FIRM|nr:MULTISPECIES: hypothetical protein [Lachnospiraceae]MCU6746406.1 hypothetical protein [Faecalicatena acetigenes]SCH16634.1 Uncharacterised protein [uncultured Clostridium sp.]
MEKAYRTMRSTGAGNIALGIIVMVTGIAAGILAIINGARLLRDKKKITF